MRDGQPIGNELTTEHGLEGVAKGLAQGTVSRRRALGALGGILGGSLLALIPGVAWAQSNQPACVRCCKEKFAPGEKHAQGDALLPATITVITASALMAKSRSAFLNAGKTRLGFCLEITGSAWRTH